jgi:hypothetical protein
MNGKRFPKIRRESNEQNSDITLRKRLKKFLSKVLLVVVILLIGILAGSVAANDDLSKMSRDSTPRCQIASEPYFNRSGFSATTPDGQLIFILDGIFSDGMGVKVPISPLTPPCDKVDEVILKEIGNMIIDAQVVDSEGNITGQERLIMHRAIVGNFERPH